MLIPNRCVPLLKEQRTNHADVKAEYAGTLKRTYESFAHLLPKNASRILDIGCGMAGIDVYLSRHYEHQTEIWLLDKGGVSPKINSGYCENADKFAHYHDWDAALELLQVNGVPLERITCVDLKSRGFPTVACSVAISLLSMGFHYPIDTYFPRIRAGGVLIADCRKDTDNVEKLEKKGEVTVVHESLKYRRVVCSL